MRPIQDVIVFDTEYTPRRGAVPEASASPPRA